MAQNPAWHRLTPDELHRMQLNANRLLIYGEDANASKQAGSDVLFLLEAIEVLDKVIDAYQRSVTGIFAAHWRGDRLDTLDFTPDPPGAAGDRLEKAE